MINPPMTRSGYTAVPNWFLDEWLPDLSHAALSVLLYVCRRTSGFGKGSDRVSLNQFCNGITKADGTHLDHGTGLSKRSVLRGATELEKLGLIVRERRRMPQAGLQATIYRLNRPTSKTTNSRLNTKSSFTRDVSKPGRMVGDR